MAILVLAVGWLAITGFLIWRSLVLAASLVTAENAWQVASTGYLNSASLWHLYTPEQHHQASMHAVWRLQDKLAALATQGSWALQGLAFFLVLLVVGWADSSVLANPLAICTPMMLLAVPDWLGKTATAATFHTRFYQARHALQSLQIKSVPVVEDKASLLKPEPVTLTRFCASNRQLSTVTATLPATGVVAVTGPSGAGKSSLLQALAGELDGQGGKSVSGQPLPAGLIARWYYVEQQAGVLQATLKDNLNPSAMAMDDKAVTQLLHRIGLGYLKHPEEWLGAGGRELSGGERKRIALVRALLHQPQTLLLDEPFEGLDRFSVNAVVSLINEYAVYHRVIIATHSLPEPLHVTQAIVLDSVSGDTQKVV